MLFVVDKFKQVKIHYFQNGSFYEWHVMFWGLFLFNMLCIHILAVDEISKFGSIFLLTFFNSTRAINLNWHWVIFSFLKSLYDISWIISKGFSEKNWNNFKNFPKHEDNIFPWEDWKKLREWNLNFAELLSFKAKMKSRNICPFGNNFFQIACKICHL